MNKHSFDTLSEAVNTLTQEGYKEDFEAMENCIKALYSKKEYQPDDLKIIDSYRFEGITNPGDQSTVFTIEANDGTKGTMVMSYSASSGQNDELIKQIPYKTD
ncbi:phosphoribosylpyrophosphate synthetase [Flagellimonas halotolerans]|uniref:Phosphoribosylpyrophosphate synthetase n=1 Tax=Flagellimonas halotolerans TaxID=3112164 RepID=A0ABU6IQD4_9FLAO|nr:MULTISPECIES: phosphoribosylpyrophosphate synthetase [unclassified Allomuricauda]MEC3965450.1 phosphoribosylpyrophosphate synthetase [Muricauda sp. SYSU M86414]MEC4265316.1 phosphoribosylpyrophosphate synthetase [Muricauda sp. SYSU M84420]